MKDRILAISILVSVLSVVMMVAFAAETISVVKACETKQDQCEALVYHLQEQQKAYRTESKKELIELEAQVQYFITGGWK